MKRKPGRPHSDRGQGRHSTRTPEIVEKIKIALSMGLPAANAARFAKVELSTLNGWLHNDPDFRQEIEDAIEGQIVARLTRIYEGKPGWQGAAWLLERSSQTRIIFAPPAAVHMPGQATNVDSKITITLEEKKAVEVQSSIGQTEAKRILDARAERLKPPGLTAEELLNTPN